MQPIVATVSANSIEAHALLRALAKLPNTDVTITPVKRRPTPEAISEVERFWDTHEITWDAHDIAHAR